LREVKKLLLVLVVIGLALAGGAWWWKRQAAVEADPCTVAAVEYGPLTELVSASGVLQPRDVYAVGSELSGKVVAVLADFNQVVEEGDVLLRLDDRQARDRLRQAEVAVEAARAVVRQADAVRDTARKALDRERHRPPEIRSQSTLDLIEGQLRTAEAAVEAAQVRVREAEEGRRQAEWGLQLTTVCAPVLAPTPEAALVSAPHPHHPGTGTLADTPASPRQRRSFVVLDRQVSLNQMIGPPSSAQLFILAGNLERMQIVALVAEADVGKVTRGMPARFTLSGSPEGEPAFTGKVEEVRLTPASDRGAIFYKVLIDARNERDQATGDWKLRPGQTVSVDVVRRLHDPVWKMPAAALSFQPDEAVQTEEARARLRRWQARPDRDQWRPVWVEGPDHLPRPILVRVGGAEGIQDGQFAEVLEWDPELPAPDPHDPATYPRPIIGMAAPHRGWLEMPRIKL
jgi:HlyD family secretion protein